MFGRIKNGQSAIISAPAKRRVLPRIVVLAGVALIALSAAAPVSATYIWQDDDIVNAMTAQARFGGNWTLGSATGGLVRWHKDDGNDVVRGEFKASTYAVARSGYNPRCIATRVRWQTLTASPSFSIPAAVSLTVGIQTLSSGWKVSCRAANSSTPPAAIFLNGVAASSWAMVRVHADICHMATSNSMWACATDTNDYKNG